MSRRPPNRLSDARFDEFKRRLLDLLTEFWGGVRRTEAGALVGEPPPDEDLAAPSRRLFAAIYLDPTDREDSGERGTRP